MKGPSLTTGQKVTIIVACIAFCGSVAAAWIALVGVEDAANRAAAASDRAASAAQQASQQASSEAAKVAVAVADRTAVIVDRESIKSAIAGVRLQSFGNYKLAISWLDQAIDQDPTNFEAYYARGDSICHLSDEQFRSLGYKEDKNSRAKADFEAVMVINPSHVDAHARTQTPCP